MNLFAANTFQSFWGIPSVASLPEEYVRENAERLLPKTDAVSPSDFPSIMAWVLGEGQYGPSHFELRGSRRLYYKMRPALPPWFRRWLHQATATTPSWGGLH